MRLDIDDLLDGLTFPLTTEQLIASVGSRRIEYPTGKEESLASVYRRVEVEEYGSLEEAELALRSALVADAVGRPGYSDRDPPIPGVNRYDHVSC